MLEPAQMPTPNGNWFMDGTAIHKVLLAATPKGSLTRVPIEVYIVTESGKKFTIHARLLGVWVNEEFAIYPQMESVTAIPVERTR
jgi:hypothetical protein